MTPLLLFRSEAFSVANPGLVVNPQRSGWLPYRWRGCSCMGQRDALLQTKVCTHTGMHCYCCYVARSSVLYRVCFMHVLRQPPIAEQNIRRLVVKWV